MAVSHEQLLAILERTREIGKELAQARCSNALCGLSRVVVEVVETPKPDSTLTYFDTLHGAACTQKSDCYFAQHPLEITEVIREAAHQIHEELGVDTADTSRPGQH